MDFPIEIKHEFGAQGLQCRTCLSVGRKLRPLGDLWRLFRKITPEWLYPEVNSSVCLQICWQCTALLRNVAVFRHQVLKADELLRTNQGLIQGTLSNLIPVTINDGHQIYYIHEEPKATSETNVDSKNHSDYDDPINETISSQDTDFKNNDFKAKSKSRWSIFRAKQNKKPKFKIISNLKNFTKVQITNEELEHCMKNERDSDVYQLSKFKCDFCVKLFVDEHLLKKHSEKYHRKGIFTCEICKSNISNKHYLLSHIRKHYYIYKCNVCMYVSRSRHLVSWHLQKDHTRVFQCIKCDLQYSSRRDFFQHFKERHEKFICDYCGITFKMKYCIKNHIRKQHSPFECKPCQRVFARYQGLWLHNKLVHARPSPPAYCVECDKYYPDKYRLQWHLANSVRHTPRKTRRIPCPECEKVFSKKTTMNQHHTLVHLKQYKYRCHPCDKNFVRNPDLVKHIRKIHEGIQPAKNKICNICGRGFTTNKILQNHVRTHTGERPFPCGACEARFAQRPALLAHMRAKHRSERDGNTLDT